MNKPQLPTIQDPSSDNILNVIEKLVENVADDNDSTTETVNVLSRSLRYPFSDVTRFYFPDSMIDWKVCFFVIIRPNSFVLVSTVNEVSILNQR